MILAEVRNFGANGVLVVYTENEAVRKALKTLPAFDFETYYHSGGPLGPLVAVDVYLSDGDQEGLKMGVDNVLQNVIC